MHGVDEGRHRSVQRVLAAGQRAIHAAVAAGQEQQRDHGGEHGEHRDHPEAGLAGREDDGGAAGPDQQRRDDEGHRVADGDRA